MLLLSYLANFISPERHTYIAFCGLIYPYILVINIIFTIYWVLQFHKYFFLSAIGILIGFSFMPRLYQFKGVSNPTDSSKTFTILSYNAHIFGLYNSKIIADSIFDYLQQEKPDVVCFQEYYQDTTHRYDKRLKKIVHAKSNYLFLEGKHHQLGLATFSAYPIVNNGIIYLPDSKGNKAIFSDICFYDDTIRVYNIHFQSVSLEKEDYNFTKKVADTEVDFKSIKTKNDAKRIMKKLKKGYMARSKQVNAIIEHIKNSPYPVIVCGDFNDIPWSYTYQQIKNLLSDAFISSGKGFGQTFYVNKNLPLRIDYIFYDKTIFNCYNFTVDKIHFSDHFPIHTLLEIKHE